MRNWCTEHLRVNSMYGKEDIALIEQTQNERYLRYVLMVQNISTFIIFIFMPLILLIVNTDPNNYEYSIYYKIFGMIFVCLIVLINRRGSNATNNTLKHISIKDRFWVYNGTGFKLAITPIVCFFFALFMLFFLYIQNAFTNETMTFVTFSFYYMSTFALYFTRYFPLKVSARKEGIVPMVFVVWETILLFLNLHIVFSTVTHLIYAVYLGVVSRKRTQRRPYDSNFSKIQESS